MPKTENALSPKAESVDCYFPAATTPIAPADRSRNFSCSIIARHWLRGCDLLQVRHG
jgi:hypothetical protein